MKYEQHQIYQNNNIGGHLIGQCQIIPGMKAHDTFEHDMLVRT